LYNTADGGAFAIRQAFHAAVRCRNSQQASVTPAVRMIAQ
jgi:hypothetical protein